MKLILALLESFSPHHPLDFNFQENFSNIKIRKVWLEALLPKQSKSNVWFLDSSLKKFFHVLGHYIKESAAFCRRLLPLLIDLDPVICLQLEIQYCLSACLF